MINAVSACTTFFPGEELILYKHPSLERTGWVVETCFEESAITPQPEDSSCFYDRRGHLHGPEKKGFFIDICR